MLCVVLLMIPRVKPATKSGNSTETLRVRARVFCPYLAQFSTISLRSFSPLLLTTCSLSGNKNQKTP